MKGVAFIERGSSLHWVGDGFPVRTIFTYDQHGAELSPFLLLDYAGPVEFPPSESPRGVGPHPHRGFETVTIVYAGELEHRDSSGGGGHIGPGDVQWMTAASGLVHEEMHAPAFTRRGGRLELIQLWVNLPAREKMRPPAYQSLTAGDIPRVPLKDAEGMVRVIAGEYAGTQGPARTFSPINLWDVRLAGGARTTLEVPAGFTTAVFVLHGRLRLKAGEDVEAAELAVLDRSGTSFTLEALQSGGEATLLVLNGQPLQEPIVGYGPFVMTSREEIRQAIEDYQAKRLGVL